MGPTKIQLDVPITFFHYPNFRFITWLLQRLPLTKKTEFLNIHHCTHIVRFKASVHYFSFLHQMIVFQKLKKAFHFI